MGLTLGTMMLWALLFDLGAACAAFLLGCGVLSAAGIPLERLPRGYRAAAAWCVLAEATGGEGYLERLRAAVGA